MSNKQSCDIVWILSNQKGCIITKKILEGQKFNFNFINSLDQIKNYGILIIDSSRIPIKSNSNHNQIIILKDTDKSHASILALSGQLSTFGQNHTKQFVPKYLVDFIVGISLSIILQAIQNQNQIKQSNKTLQISIIDLVKYFGAFNISAKQNKLATKPLGQNILEGGAPFYRLYKCKKGTLAVGNLQPKFYNQMVKALKLKQQTEQFLLQNQLNTQKWTQIGHILRDCFLAKQASEWQKIMSKYDTCVTQVSQKPRQIIKNYPKLTPLLSKL